MYADLHVSLYNSMKHGLSWEGGRKISDVQNKTVNYYVHKIL